MWWGTGLLRIPRTRNPAHCVAVSPSGHALRGSTAMVHTRAHADDGASLPRPGPERPRALRQRRRVDAAARRRGRRRRTCDGCRRSRVRGLRRRDRLPEHGSPVRAGRRGDPPPGRPVPAPVLHGRRLRALRRHLPVARGALAVRRSPNRSRSSSTRGPRRTRTPSRSRALRRAGRPSSSSTTLSTAAPC